MQQIFCALAVAVSTFAVFISAYASEISNPEKLSEELIDVCGQDRGFPRAIAACVEAKDREYGAQLETAYKNVLTKFPAIAASLRQSQRAWLSFQHSNCQYHMALGGIEGPSFGQLSLRSCELRMTLERLYELRSALE